jgi:FdhD protein
MILMNNAEKTNIIRIDQGMSRVVVDTIARETQLTIMVNEEELVTLLCSPNDMKYLAIGFLVSEGVLSDVTTLQNVTVEEERGIAWIRAYINKSQKPFRRFISSGCGRGTSFYSSGDVDELPPVVSRLTLPYNHIMKLVSNFQRQSDLFKVTGSVHSAALASGDTIVLFKEDIGRHNAVDKIFGQCLLEGRDLADYILVTSGRLSSEIVLKAIRRGLPLVISRSAPTNLAVKLADRLGLSIVGFVRNQRMNIYCHSERITNDD